LGICNRVTNSPLLDNRERVKEENMDADKITLGGYIAYLKGIYQRYGNISIAQLKHIERNRKKENKQ
jgi:hypothetical protein